MSNPNRHIKEFIDYYCAFEGEPNYALLIKGKWGVGKTWFINESLDRLEERGGKKLYVSLYGMTSFDQIEDAFFKQLHPLLSSKSMALTGKIAKSFLKMAFKFDVDDDGKPDGTISMQVPDIEIPDYLTDTSGFVIVFDDLERASLPIEDLLGYINHYVEHQGHKVIIVANEEEIIERQENDEENALPYRRIKEKLIGRTFELKPDFCGALDGFISGVESEKVRELYRGSLDVIADIYHGSLYVNLRHLKQSLWDFERFFSFIDAEQTDKEGVLEHLLKIFLALSFEIKSGYLLAKDIFGLKDGSFSMFFDKGDDGGGGDKSIYEILSGKYKSVSFLDLLIDESVWFDFFDKGSCCRESLKESLGKSSYFINENTPDWEKLWRFMDLSDDEFEGLLVSVKKDFYDMAFDEVGVFQHVAGIFLRLSKAGLINENEDEIVSFSFSYLDELKRRGCIVSNRQGRDIMENEVWGGLGFHDKDSEEFRRIVDYLLKIREEAIFEDYPGEGDELLGLIAEDPDLFYRRVVLCNNSDNLYYKVPIFSHVKPDDFVSKFLSASPLAKRVVCYAFSKRYEFDQFNDFLSGEIGWLKDVIEIMKEKKMEREGKISGYQIQESIDNYFNPSLTSLEKSVGLMGGG